MTTKVPLQSYTWKDGETDYMANYSTKDIAGRLGVSIRTVQRRVNKENWERNEQTQTPNNDTKGDNDDKDTSAGKQTNTPVSLTKLDEPSYERYLLSVANNNDPSINIAREIRSFLDQKGAIKQERKEAPEFEGINFKEIYDGAKAIINNNEREVSS